MDDDGALLLDGWMDGGLGHGFLELAAMDILNKSGRREGEGVPRLFVLRRSVEEAAGLVQVPSLLFFFLSLLESISIHPSIHPPPYVTCERRILASVCSRGDL